MAINTGYLRFPTTANPSARAVTEDPTAQLDAFGKANIARAHELAHS